MKYLNYEQLDELNNTMACMDTGDARIFARIEAYSCKNTENDRRLKALVEMRFPTHRRSTSGSSATADTPSGATAVPTQGDHAGQGASSFVSLAGSSFQSPRSPFGTLDAAVSRKTFFYLLATLNAAFPDYDFSEVKPDLFSRLPSVSIPVTKVNNTILVHLAGSDADQKRISANIWDAIDGVIELNDCDIYSFNPDGEFEPDGETASSLWSFYFFFLNRRLKRVVFMTARAVSFLAPAQPEEMNIYNNISDIGSYPYTDASLKPNISFGSHGGDGDDDDDDPIRARRTLRDIGGSESMGDVSSISSVY